LKSEIATENPAAADVLSGGDSIGISLLDLAEILDQHKSGWSRAGIGRQGRSLRRKFGQSGPDGREFAGRAPTPDEPCGRDLSMANLRGVSLVRSNLQNANLLGTELRGANLMGANLYGAEGLWFGRLGGTNLFDAVLPESISAGRHLEGDRDATKIARWFYFLTVGASLLCCLLIAFTTDVRLLLNTSALPFMRLGNVLP